MAPSREKVFEALSTVNDPELGIDVVSLGLIYDVKMTGERVGITMTLTTPGCPLVPYFHDQLTEAVKKIPGVADVQITVTFDPPWNPTKISAKAKHMLSLYQSN